MTVIARDDVTLALVTDVASTAHYFQLKASTASAPTAPTVYPAPSPWVTTEPTYTEGATNSLYTVDVTVFSDGSFDYTPVSLSSSYEAAKAAYNKAQQAQSTATTAQTTANGKNKIFSSASEPSHTGIVPGDMWFQLDSSKNVSGIKVWNGSAFTDMVLLANKLLVASSVGTTQIADNAIVTGKIAANAITAIKIAAQTITGDKLDVGSVAAAIVTSGKFQTATSGARVVMDSNGIKAYDASGNVTFQVDASTGATSMIGGMSTGVAGQNRIAIAYDSTLAQGQLNVVGSNDRTLFQLMGDTDASGFNSATMTLANDTGTVSDITMRNRSSANGGTLIAIESNEIELNSTAISYPTNQSGGREPIQPSSMVVTQASRSDYQSNLGTALAQIQFTTLSGSSLYSLSSGGVKVPYDGLYLVTGSGYYNKQQAGQGRNTFVYKNNAQVAASPGFSLNSAAYSIGYALCAPVRCAAGDIIYVKTNGGLAAHQWDKTNVITIARVSG
jgi:hypothetical protein